MLFGVKKRIEIIAPCKITLRRAGRQSDGLADGLAGILALLCFMANVTGLLRLGRELLNVAFNTGFVAGEFQAELFVALCRRHQILHQIALIVTGIALQFMCLIRARHFDDASMRLMREAFVINGRLRWRSRNSLSRRNLL